ncbi:PREDICTED: uncharacterized protein LOC106628954 isoform X2 [Pseudopodoces humilis]|uniref:uncharacterized protein LOC106628954 isoform X2 n=1 Tax=Pseudopodoces humilis TaxID=181119 RepID=UPI0006B6CF7E|nr:PREDICTED: uncharacterized protein LOC106628954 isoform X2 [Pseudopodoces humilis]
MTASGICSVRPGGSHVTPRAPRRLHRRHFLSPCAGEGRASGHVTRVRPLSQSGAVLMMPYRRRRCRSHWVRHQRSPCPLGDPLLWMLRCHRRVITGRLRTAGPHGTPLEPGLRFPSCPVVPESPSEPRLSPKYRPSCSASACLNRLQGNLCSGTCSFFSPGELLKEEGQQQ